MKEDLLVLFFDCSFIHMIHVNHFHFVNYFFNHLTKSALLQN